MASKSEISSFLGLANVSDPIRVGLRGLVVADNVEVDSTGALRKRAGRVSVAPGIFISGFATEDEASCYLQQTDGIYRLNADETLSLVEPLGTTEALKWAEFNGKVYFAGEDSTGVLDGDEVLPLSWDRPSLPQVRIQPGTLPAGKYQFAVTHVMPDGRETGASMRGSVNLPEGSAIELSPYAPPHGWTVRVYVTAADSTSLLLLGETAGDPLLFDVSPNRLGDELRTENTMPIPAGLIALTACRGQLWGATLAHDGKQSVIWSSLPLAPHLWQMTEGYFSVRGTATLLADGGDALLVGTGEAIYAYRFGDGGPVLQTLASYGVPDGDVAAKDGQTTYIWTKRGVCRYPEFTNLTERRVSVPPGSVANAAVVHDRGQVRFLACLAAGGHAFNPHQ